MFFGKKRQKVFVVGRNKTGTTSIAGALKDAGFVVGCQQQAELLIDDWINRDFREIIKYCKSADAFQDIPFSLPYTYQAVDQAFPGSKFILTVRDSSLQWYESITRFYTNLLGSKKLPTFEELSVYPYAYKGWLWKQQQAVYGDHDGYLYDQDNYIRNYEKHNADIIEYFRFRPEDLLVINLANVDAGVQITNFLGLKDKTVVVPHLNKSTD